MSKTKQTIMLPMVAETELHGVKINVRAAKFGAIRAVMKCESDEDKLDKMAELVASSCTYEDGAPVDVDELSVDDIATLTGLAMGGSADFQKPPAGTRSDGAA